LVRYSDMLKSISIIIPTYNRANYLETLINQLLSQSQPPHEIIVVDDHSTDNTAKVVQGLASKHPRIKYVLNAGHHQRDGKRTGLEAATGEYIGFFDDDAQVENSHFLAKLAPRLHPRHVVQAKVILEQMGRKNRPDITWKDILATRPYPVLELVTSNFNCGTKPRPIFPLIEWGNFWHHSLKNYFIDNNLIKDAYGESYSASLKLHRARIKLLLEPSLVIRHPGASTGGSHKFHKKTMLADFTEFHYGYFYNMIYLHKRFFPYWVWLWLPFYFTKSLVALAVNWNLKGWYKYAYQPIKRVTRREGFQPERNSERLAPSEFEGRGSGTVARAGKAPPRQDPQPKPLIFIWQGGFRGGAEYITLSAAEHFSKHGLDVTLGVYKKKSSTPLKQIVFPKPKLIPASFRSLFSSLIFRARYASKFSAVYAHTLGAWRSKHNQLFIHDAADLDTKLSQIKPLFRKLVYKIWRFLYLNLSLKTATALLATPEFSAYLIRHSLPPQRITLTGSFYDDRIFRYVKRLLPLRPVQIVFVGNHRDPAKNFRLVKNLFYKNKDFTVTVVGNFTSCQDANFRYQGWLKPPQLQRALTQAHVLFMPSKSEGFSIALLEALATGLPCLVNQAAIPSQLKDIRNLISYQAESGIISKINKIMENYPLYNVLDNHLKQFTQSNILSREYNIINQALTKQPSIK